MGCSASSSQSQIHPKRGGLGDSTSHRVRVTGLSNDGQLLMDNSLREQSRLDISVAAAHVPSVNRLSPRGPNPRLRKKAEGNEEDPAYMEQLNQALIQSLMEHELNEGEERMIKEVLKISEFEHKKNEFDFKEIKKGKVLSKAQKDTLTELKKELFPIPKNAVPAKPAFAPDRKNSLLNTNANTNNQWSELPPVEKPLQLAPIRAAHVLPPIQRHSNQKVSIHVPQSGGGLQEKPVDSPRAAYDLSPRQTRDKVINVLHSEGRTSLLEESDASLDVFAGMRQNNLPNREDVIESAAPSYPSPEISRATHHNVGLKSSVGDFQLSPAAEADFDSKPMPQITLASAAQITTVDSSSQLYAKPFQPPKGMLESPNVQGRQERIMEESYDPERNDMSVSAMEKEFEDFERELKGDILPGERNPIGRVGGPASNKSGLTNTPTLSRLEAEFGGGGVGSAGGHGTGTGTSAKGSFDARGGRGGGDLSSRAANDLIAEELNEETPMQRGRDEDADFLFS